MRSLHECFFYNCIGLHNKFLLIGALATPKTSVAYDMAAKSYLKQARDLINKKDFQGASDAAALVLQYDPVNYNAWVSGVLIDRRVNLDP